MSGKRRGNGPFKMTLAQQARTMSYYNPAIKKENFLTADRNEIQPALIPDEDSPGNQVRDLWTSGTKMNLKKGTLYFITGKFITKSCKENCRLAIF